MNIIQKNKIYLKIITQYNILDFNFQWYKWGKLFHEKFTLFSKNKHQSIFLQILKLLYFNLRFLTIKKKRYRKCDVLFFYETSNQKKALKNISEKLVYNNINVLVLNGMTRKSNQIYESSVSFNIFDLLFSIHYITINLKNIISNLKKIDKQLIKYQLSDFLAPFIWIYYFIDIIESTKPKLVVISNDHNPSNRSLISVCNIFQIKTVYIQHASITPFMPPICCDMNFLYGRATKDIYFKINNSDESNSNFKKRNFEIIYSGIQKYNFDYFFTKDNSELLKIGIAINQDDPISEIKLLIDRILHFKKKSKIILRYHPGQSSDSKKIIYKYFGGLKNIEISNPNIMNLNDFFKKITFLIAGNSGIILDSVIRMKPTYYFMFDKSSIYDVYQFIKYGLVEEIKDDNILLILTKKCYNIHNKDNIKYFDETFDTKFSGDEINLICHKILKEI